MPDTKSDRPARMLGPLTDQLYAPASAAGNGATGNGATGNGATGNGATEAGSLPVRAPLQAHTAARHDASLSALSQAAANMVPQTLSELEHFSKLISKSAIVPEAYRGKPADIMVAILHGLEIGLKPLQALQNLAVINGKPSIYGDAAIAVVRASPLCEFIVETFDEETMTATCRAKRVGEPEQIRTFSKADAVRAGLWDERPKIRKKGRDGGHYEAANPSPWYCYPKRMLQMRARSWNLRDNFADVMSGLWLREEAMDIPRASGRPLVNPVPADPPVEDAEWEEASEGAGQAEDPPPLAPSGAAPAVAGSQDGAAATPAQYDRLSTLLASDVWTSGERTRKMQNLRRMTEAQAERYLMNIEATREERLEERLAERSERQRLIEETDWKDGAPFDGPDQVPGNDELDPARVADEVTEVFVPTKPNPNARRISNGTADAPGQLQRLHAIAGAEGGFTRLGVKRLLGVDYGFASSEEVTVDVYDEICRRLADPSEAARWNRDPNTADLFGAEGLGADSTLPSGAGPAKAPSP